MALFRLRRFDEAADCCNQASELLATVEVSQALPALGRLATCLYGLSRFEDTVQLCARVMAHAPDDPAAQLFVLASVSLTHVRALRELGRLHEAHAAAAGLIEKLRGPSMSAPEIVGADGEPLSAAVVAEVERRVLPGWQEVRRWFVKALLNQASIARLLGRRDEAHALIAEAIEFCQAQDHFPEYTEGFAEALCKRAQLFEEARDIERATNTCGEVISRFADSSDPKVEAWVKRARLKRQALRN